MDISVLFIASEKTEKETLERDHAILNIFFKHFSELSQRAVTCRYRMIARDRRGIAENLGNTQGDVLVLVCDEPADLIPEKSMILPVLADPASTANREALSDVKVLHGESGGVSGFLIVRGASLTVLCPSAPKELANVLQNELGPHLLEENTEPVETETTPDPETETETTSDPETTAPSIQPRRTWMRQVYGRRLKMADVLLRVLLGLAVCAVLYFSYRLLRAWIDSVTSVNDYESIAQMAHMSEREWNSPVEAASGLDWPEATPYLPVMHVDFMSLQTNANNQDLIGYIRIDGTKIDYPVVQTRDNAYYLNHSYMGKTSAYGCIFLDGNAVVTAGSSSQNLVLYGRRMNDGEMFGTLKLYRDLNYYREHPLIWYNDIYRENIWKIFSIYIVNTRESDDEGSVFDYTRRDFEDDLAFMDFIKETKRRSVINIPVAWTPGDQLLTLSTSDDSFTDARLVVVAKRVLTPEEADVDVLRAKNNPYPLYPEAWYRAFGGQKPTEQQMRVTSDIY